MTKLDKSDPSQLLASLEEKLAADESFTKSRILGMLSNEVLSFVSSRFVLMRNRAKLNLLLSILHMSNNNLEQWREPLDEILSVAVRDTDEWVQMIGLLLINYPAKRVLDFDCIDDDNNGVSRTYHALLKSIMTTLSEKNAKTASDNAISKRLPTTSKASDVQSAAGVKKHYQPRKRPKAFVERLECLQRAEMARIRVSSSDQLDKERCCSRNAAAAADDSAVEMHGHRSPFVQPPRRSTDSSLVESVDFGRQTFKTSYASSPTAPKTPHSGGELKSSATPLRRDSMVKVIELSETPQALRSQRRKSEQEEKAAKRAAREELKKQKLEERAAREAMKKLKADDAAHTVDTVLENLMMTDSSQQQQQQQQTQQQQQEKQQTLLFSVEPSRADYLPNVTLRSVSAVPTRFDYKQPDNTVTGMPTLIAFGSSKLSTSAFAENSAAAATATSSSQMPRIEASANAPKFYRIEVGKTTNVGPQVVAIRQPVKIIRAPVSVWPGLSVVRNAADSGKRFPNPNAAGSVQQPIAVRPVTTNTKPMPARSIDDMFDNANCLTPADRMQIAQFIRSVASGSQKKDSPTVLIKVDDRFINQTQADGTSRMIQQSILCRLNYETGRIEKVINTRPLTNVGQSDA